MRRNCDRQPWMIVFVCVLTYASAAAVSALASVIPDNDWVVADKAKAALLALKRADRQQFVADFKLDMLGELQEIVRIDNHIYMFGPFVVDVQAQTYWANIGMPPLSRVWVYAGKFHAQPDGSWVAEKPTIRYLRASRN